MASWSGCSESVCFCVSWAVEKIIFRGHQKWSPIASLTNRDEIFRDFQLNFAIVQGTMLSWRL